MEIFERGRGTISSSERLAYPSWQSRPQMICLYSKAMSLRAKYKDTFIMWTRCWAETAGWWHTEPCQPFSDDFFLISTAWARFEPERAGHNFPLCWEAENTWAKERGSFPSHNFSPDYLLLNLYNLWPKTTTKKEWYFYNATPTSGSYFAVGPGGNKTDDLFIWVASLVKLEPLLDFTKINLTN